MKRLGVLVVSGLATMALMAPGAATADPVDVGAICTSLVGDREGSINLDPLVRIGYQTCAKADLDD